MATDWKEMEPGFEGGQCNMVPATMISRFVEGDDPVAFGRPVKRGVDDKSCVEGIEAGNFVGITVRQRDVSQFDAGCEARIMTQGVIWVKAAGAVSAGDKVSYDTGWTTGAGVELINAQYDTSGGADELVQIRMYGVEA